MRPAALFAAKPTKYANRAKSRVPAILNIGAAGKGFSNSPSAFATHLPHLVLALSTITHRIPVVSMTGLTTGGWDNNAIDDAQLPADFVIAYIRAWQRKT